MSTYGGGKEISARLIIYKNISHNQTIPLACIAGSRGGVSLLIKRSCDIVQSGGKGGANDKLYFLGIDLENRLE